MIENFLNSGVETGSFSIHDFRGRDDIVLAIHKKFGGKVSLVGDFAVLRIEKGMLMIDIFAEQSVAKDADLEEYSKQKWEQDKKKYEELKSKFE